MRRLLLALALLALSLPAQAVGRPDEMLRDPALESRAREVGRELRCLVCQNQSIEDSEAELARDLRRLVRERIAAGDSDTAALRFVHERYGDFVLLRPPLNAGTVILWATPFLALGGGILAILLLRRRGTAAGAPPAAVAGVPELTPEERARLAALEGAARE